MSVKADVVSLLSTMIEVGGPQAGAPLTIFTSEGFYPRMTLITGTGIVHREGQDIVAISFIAGGPTLSTGQFLWVADGKKQPSNRACGFRSVAPRIVRTIEVGSFL